MKSIYLAAMTILIAFHGCCEFRKIEASDIIGTWVPELGWPEKIRNIITQEQPYFVFASDGSFIARNIPALYLWGAFPDTIKIVSGYGKWQIKKYQGQKIVSLDFEELNKGIGLHTHINISCGLESIILFFWIDDEGGDKLKFRKKISD